MSIQDSQRARSPGRLVQRAISRPEMAAQAITRTARLTLREGIKSGYLFFDSEYLEGDRYRRHVHGLDDQVVTTVAGTKLRIRPDDPGISRQLCLGRVHERAATSVFRQELAALERASPDPLVLEIGGNIGYYATLELTTLETATLHVVEPSQDNIDLLEENLRLNGVRDRATITRGAISDRTGEKDLVLQAESNLHSFETEADAGSRTETVQSWTVGDYLDDQGIDPSDISVLRMDVEGHEGKIFETIDPVLDASGPLLVFVELHETLLENGALEDVFESLRDGGLRLVYACNDNFVDGPTNELDSLDAIRRNLREYNNVEAFFRRGY